MQSLLPDKDIALVSGRDGYFLVNRNDVYVGKAIEIYGEYNAREGEIFPFLIGPGVDVIEGGKVYAFEHQRACFSLRLEGARSLIEFLFSMVCRLWWHIPPLFNPDSREPHPLSGSAR